MPLTTTLSAQQVLNSSFTTGSADLVALGVTDSNGVLQNDPTTGLPFANVIAGSTINSTDALNTNYRCIYQILASWDNKTYQSIQQYEWLGGSTDKNGNPTGPSLGTGIPTTAPDGSANGPPLRITVFVDPETFPLNMGVILTFKS